MTSSLDCTARVWTHEGQYVGTFGQAENWDLSDDLTWSHPFIPDDVLVDPTSVPNIEKDEPEEFTRKTNSKNENESESQQWLNEVREALKTSNGKRLKIQRHLSKQPKEVAVDPASNAFRFVFKTPLFFKNIIREVDRKFKQKTIFRALKVHDMFPEPEFRKPKSQINDDDFLMQLAREMS